MLSVVTDMTPRKVLEYPVHQLRSKPEILNQCWLNVGPSSAKLAQHQATIESLSRVCWVDAFL